MFSVCFYLLQCDGFQLNIDDDNVAIEETYFWKKMQSNRIGNLLSAARFKANISQSQLAETLGIRQNMGAFPGKPTLEKVK